MLFLVTYRKAIVVVLTNKLGSISVRLLPDRSLRQRKMGESAVTDLMEQRSGTRRPRRDHDLQILQVGEVRQIIVGDVAEGRGIEDADERRKSDRRVSRLERLQFRKCRKMWRRRNWEKGC